jgi:TRAP-type mannitol/chloroaromatic compound transport system permease small subunit
MSMIVRWIEAFTTLVGNLGALILAPLICAMLYEVLARHMFGAPTFWAYEVGYMLAGTSYLFGFSYALMVGAHVRVDFIYGQLSPRAQAAVDILGFVFLLLPGVVWLTYALGGYTWNAYLTGEVSGESAWNPVVWPFRTGWVIGFAALSLQTIAEIIKCARVLTGHERGGHAHVEARL